jgi:hypothetical protein
MEEEKTQLIYQIKSSINKKDTVTDKLLSRIPHHLFEIDQWAADISEQIRKVQQINALIRNSLIFIYYFTQNPFIKGD